MTTLSTHPETLGLHGGSYRADPATNAVAVPIYQTTSYQFNDADHAANLFGLSELGNIYTRIMNPTAAVLEERLAQLEGAVAGLAVSSGQAAISTAILTIAQAGDNIVASTDLYGGTINLFSNSLRQIGIDVRWADPADPENFRRIVVHLSMMEHHMPWNYGRALDLWLASYGLTAAGPIAIRTSPRQNMTKPMCCARG